MKIKIIYLVIAAVAFLCGWISSFSFTAKSFENKEIQLLGIQYSTRDNEYTFENVPFTCKPYLKTGDCSTKIVSYYEFLINDGNTRQANIMKAAEKIIKNTSYPVPQLDLTRKRMETKCNNDVLGGGVKCTTTY